MSSLNATTLGRYTLLSRLGAGGMGEAWRARDANLDREVTSESEAVKLGPISLLSRSVLDNARYWFMAVRAGLGDR